VPGFAVDTDSLIDVANSLETLRHVLNSIATDDVTQTEVGGLVLAQQLDGFNGQWRAGVGVISGEVQNLQDALFTAAAHYERAEQVVSNQSHDTPTGAGPAIGGTHLTAPGPHRPHHPGHKPSHTHPKHHDHDADRGKRHHRETGTGTTTIGPRPPLTGTGTGTTVIGGAPEHGHKDHEKDAGAGSGTTTIGPGGVSTTVDTGPGRGHGTTVIGGDDLLHETDRRLSGPAVTER
jgi:hypothetical protein